MRILVVDDDETLRLTVRAALETRNYQVEEAEDGAQAVEMVTSGAAYDAVLLDVNMPRMNGIEALTKIKEFDPKIFCLILTAYSDVKDAINAIKHGAYDYLEKPVDGERILKLIDQAVQANKMVEMAGFSAPQLQFGEGKDMIGESRSIKKVFEVIYKLSKVDTSVLIRGESGTGKELVAQALHYNSHRKKGPFVAVNCAAIPENLIESELFGHEKGSFTGAERKKLGKFQYASGGTIFLDEIGDMTVHMQVKLLRVLQEKKFTPVGANQEVSCDVRVIAATNRPLEEMIKNDKFRADLFYRLNVLPIVLPPLRDRREDIAALTTFMIEKFNKVHDRNIKGIDKDALNALRLYSWPGNIRELENVIEHAFIIETTDTIEIGALPEHIQKTQPGQSENRTSPQNGTSTSQAPELITDFSSLNYPQLKEQFEQEFIIRALKAFNGRINQTAMHTQMTKVTLLRKLEKYGINPKDYHQQK